MAREREAFALKHRLPPERVFQERPQLAVSAGFSGLRKELSDEERSARADRQLAAAGIRRKAEPRPAVHRASKPAPPGPTRLVRTGGTVLDVH